MQDKWRTTIRPGYKLRLVLKASFGGGTGIACLVGVGAFMPLELLKVWGFPVLVAASTLIAWSMLPYRRMTRLENNPDELWTNSNGDLVYAVQKSPIMTIPLGAIDKCFYIDKPQDYGIAIAIKPHPSQKIRVHNSGLDFRAYQQATVLRYGCDIFLPFFSERSFKNISEFLAEQNS